ncbi:hypothetical protein FDP41_004239 [Naegleria fowleri]|uniref:Uncharacterized protein n=1 Tax=Naegleria fowleri TaxID=5763 RepID=A0A6A5BRY1_NAEFO|nr:uncharacterized protein FDP41_004239 [Naegleria fowleri]KAF0976944.1 hypothetical protein FDP41_004239 [Naegleria fowleri]CAG4711848.1 unnamed protein product [Naegleria fowleri]
MSNPTTPAYANRELLKSIVDFLSRTTTDNEETQLAVQMLRNTYSIGPVENNNTINLEQVWRAGCEKLDIVDYSMDEKFKAFMKQLDSMGYFKNTSNTDTYEMRYEKAKLKFQEKMKSHQQTTTGSASSAVDVEKAEKAKEEGNEKLKNKDYEGAIESYRIAMQYNPQNHIYPSNMAAAYISLGQYEKALKCCEQSIKLNDTYVKAYQRLAQCQAKLNKKKEAIKTYEKLIDLNPESATEYAAKIEQLSSTSSTSASNPFAGLGGLGGLGGGMPNLGGLSEMLNNPQFMQMAMNMMQQPGMQEMVSNMMRNMGGSGGLFGNMPGMDGANMDEQQRAVMSQILEEPEVQQSEKLTRIFTEVRDNGPQTLMQHMSDPEVSAFMQRYATKMLGSGNPFANIFGSAANQPRRDDDNDGGNSNMYA